MMKKGVVPLTDGVEEWESCSVAQAVAAGMLFTP